VVAANSDPLAGIDLTLTNPARHSHRIREDEVKREGTDG
jgi:hypothetical protein